MKEELKNLLLQNLNDVIESSKKGASNLIDALYAQCPDLINQIINYGIASNSLLVIIGSINIILYITSLIIVMKNWNKIRDLDYDEVVFGFKVIWGIISFALTTVLVVIPTMNILQAIIAPKLYLIEYIKQLLN